MRAIASGCSMLATIFSRTGHRGYVSIPMPNTRFRRRGQRIAP
jgi:hypothetical protein